MEGFFCQFADKCQYAHGKHELRTKPTFKPEEISDDLRQRLIDKAKARADYKTKLCKNYEDTGTCDFSDICHFAHGSTELRDPPAGSEAGSSSASSQSIHFKTSMCKFGNACQNGSSCKFAHTETELRPSPYPVAATSGGGIVIPNVSSHGSSGLHKTIMCKNYLATQQCSYGERCLFAHSRSELNSVSIKNHAHYSAAAAAATPSSASPMAAGSRDPKYKTSLCHNWKNLGLCEMGSFCVFAHGMSELRKPPTSMTAPSSTGLASVLNSDSNSRFKTSLCLSYVSTGYCDRASSCAFAHGEHELRNLATYKTVMCKHNNDGSACSKGVTCHYAHTVSELRSKVSAVAVSGHGHGGVGSGIPVKRKQPVLKTALCSNYAKYGECSYGDNCNFAHGEVELQGSKRQRY